MKKFIEKALIIILDFLLKLFVTVALILIVFTTIAAICEGDLSKGLFYYWLVQ